MRARGLAGLAAFSLGCGRVAFDPTIDASASAIGCAETAPIGPVFFVATDGSDSLGDGSSASPWQTIDAAIMRVPDPATILVRAGTYYDTITIAREFATGLLLRSEQRYLAQLRYPDRVIACYECNNVIIEGFDIGHDALTPDGFQLIHVQDLGSDSIPVRDIVLRGNVFHDTTAQALVRINNGATRVTIERNVFYNQGDNSQQLHLNEIADITVQDNVFFNDLAGSGRPAAGSVAGDIIYVQGATVRASNVTIRRNVILNWQGAADRTMITIDSTDGALIENNVLLGGSAEQLRAPVRLSGGSTGVTIRNNTIVGPFTSTAFSLALEGAMPHEAAFRNNLCADSAGVISALFVAPVGDMSTIAVARNLFWNGGAALPTDMTSSVQYTDDAQRVVGDPLLPPIPSIVLPRLVPDSGAFADGSTTSCEIIARVAALVTISPASPAAYAAIVTESPADDILRRPRTRPSIGAVEIP